VLFAPFCGHINNRIKLFGIAILVPNAAMFLLSLTYPIKSIFDLFARQHHPCTIHPNCISHSIFVHSGPQCSYKSLPQFHLALILHQWKTG
jgi:hypothetical protein